MSQIDFNNFFFSTFYILFFFYISYIIWYCYFYWFFIYTIKLNTYIFQKNLTALRSTF